MRKIAAVILLLILAVPYVYGQVGVPIGGVSTNPVPVAISGVPFHFGNAGGHSPCTLTINPGGVGKYIYVTSFWVGGAGATSAANIVVTYTGLEGGTSFDSITVPAGPTTPITPLEHQFPYPWQAAAANTQVQITVADFGAGNTAVACHVNGFYQ